VRKLRRGGVRVVLSLKEKVLVRMDKICAHLTTKSRTILAWFFVITDGESVSFFIFSKTLALAKVIFIHLTFLRLLFILRTYQNAENNTVNSCYYTLEIVINLIKITSKIRLKTG
jgi:hypothetical protein